MFLLQTSITPGQSLTIAIVAAVFTQLIIVGISSYKFNRDLRVKRELLEEDLKDKKSSLLALYESYCTLLTQLNNRDLKRFISDAFPDLNSNLYQSVQKSDLYRIYEKKIVEIVKIYNAVDYLSKGTSSLIYGEYVRKWKEHVNTESHKASHVVYCDSHIAFIEIASEQSKLNMNTCKTLIEDIDKILNLNNR